MRGGLAPRSARAETEVYPEDLVAPRASSSLSKEAEHPGGPSVKGKKSGSVSAKRRDASHVVLPPPPATPQVSSLAQRQLDAVPLTSLVPKGRGRAQTPSFEKLWPFHIVEKISTDDEERMEEGGVPPDSHTHAADLGGWVHVSKEKTILLVIPPKQPRAMDTS